MNKKAELKVGNLKGVIEFFEDRAPVTTEKIWRLLPLEVPLCHAKFAGDELMFMVPGVIDAEYAKESIEVGDILYYPVQQTICMFYGEHIVPFGSGPYNAIGKIIDGYKDLTRVAELITQQGFQWAQFTKLTDL